MLRADDTVRVTLGLAPAGEPLYTGRVISTGPLSRIDLPGSEEGRAHGFFDEAARIAGRATT